MKFYAYRGVYPLGKEPLGTEGKLLFELQTVKGAIRQCRQTFKGAFTLYSYLSFYNDKTFTLRAQFDATAHF